MYYTVIKHSGHLRTLENISLLVELMHDSFSMFCLLYFPFLCKDPGLHENVETKPEETGKPEAEDDLSDNELGAVVEFDEDELDEAQTEADVKNITTKHHITIEELKREVLGSVKKITLTL